MVCIYQLTDFAGEHIYKANPKIIEALDAGWSLGIINQSNTATHTAGVIKHRLSSVRHHNGLSAWMPKVCAKNALNAIENEINFVPDWGKIVFKAMIEGRPDWCISRQRTGKSNPILCA